MSMVIFLSKIGATLCVMQVQKGVNVDGFGILKLMSIEILIDIDLKMVIMPCF